MARKAVKEQVILGLIQMSADDSLPDNLAKAVERTAAAAKKGARIVCLQELFRSRYFCQSENQRNFKLAESIPGPTTDALAAGASEREIVIVASVLERRSAGIDHNTAFVRKILFYHGRTRLSQLSNPLRKDRGAGLLG